MFKPLTKQAQRLWGIFGTIRKWFLGQTKSKENKFKQEEQEIQFEEEQLKKRGARDYIFDRLNERKEELQQQKDEFYSFKNLVDTLPKNQSPVFYFDALLDILAKMGRTEETMEVGKIYTFKYIARTKGQWYDVHPVSLIIEKGKTYWRGVNYHWERNPEYIESPIRTYSFIGMQSLFYRIKQEELEYVLRIPSFYPVFISGR
jgi:hypothetical protein